MGTAPPLTCQYCRHAPATHVLVADLADSRAVHLVCGPCGGRSLPHARRISKARSSAWLFTLALVTPEPDFPVDQKQETQP